MERLNPGRLRLCHADWEELEADNARDWIKRAREFPCVWALITNQPLGVSRAAVPFCPELVLAEIWLSNFESVAMVLHKGQPIVLDGLPSNVARLVDGAQLTLDTDEAVLSYLSFAINAHSTRESPRLVVESRDDLSQRQLPNGRPTKKAIAPPTLAVLRREADETLCRLGALYGRDLYGLEVSVRNNGRVKVKTSKEIQNDAVNIVQHFTQGVLLRLC